MMYYDLLKLPSHNKHKLKALNKHRNTKLTFREQAMDFKDNISKFALSCFFTYFHAERGPKLKQLTSYQRNSNLTKANLRFYKNLFYKIEVTELV